MPLVTSCWQDPVGAVNRRLEGFVEKHLAQCIACGVAPYPVDVREDDQHYYVEAEIPGFTKDEIDVSLEMGVLTIRGRRHVPRYDNEDFLRKERHWTRVLRSIVLPDLVAESGVKATLENGVLSIVLERRHAGKSRKIEVETAGGSQVVGAGLPPVRSIAAS